MKKQHRTKDKIGINPRCKASALSAFQKNDTSEPNNQLLEPLPTKQLRFPTPKRNLKTRTKNQFRQANRDTTSIQQKPRPHHKKQKQRS